MFDPETSSLIRQAPRLPNLDIERLPEELTQAFASIVSFRVRLAGTPVALPAELMAKLDQFRRMAGTFETLVALTPDLANRRAAAFVAAHAQQLLHLARAAASPPRQRLSPFRADAISPEASALLLFLIANQPSDAMEMARALNEVRPAGDNAPALLVEALAALAGGRLTDIQLLSARLTQEMPLDSCDAAVEMLYRRLLDGMAMLSGSLLEASSGSQELNSRASQVFREVQMLSVQEEPWPRLDDVSPTADVIPMSRPPVSTFAGPHHLATLLLAAGEILGPSALSGVLPPEGVSSERWRRQLRFIVGSRPFLWPNHLQALAQGFLSPGTSSVISFPTGAGKTTLSELKTAAALALGGAVIYLAPTHALVAQMKADLARTFTNVPVRESLLVDDFYAEIDELLSPQNPQIVVMTPERCLALLSLGTADFGLVRLVIFDECHLIHPSELGQNRRSLDAMLAVLNLHESAPFADWLLLSAMMANAVEIAAWLQELTGRPCLALNLDWKPTRQARGCLVYDQEAIGALKTVLKGQERAARKSDGFLPDPKPAVQALLSTRPFGFFSLRQTWQTMNLQDYSLLALLEHAVPLSASITPKDKTNPQKRRYYYLTPNKNEVAAHLAARCAATGLKVLLFAQNTLHVGAIARNVEELVPDGLHPPQLSVYEEELLRVAIDEAGSRETVIAPKGCAGSHQGLMLPAERELVESLFRRRGGIRVLAATPTLAQGMNLPADVVFIVGDERFDKGTKGFSPLDAHELLNAAGRAGRAGHVAQGMVVVLPHTLVTFDPASHEIGAGWVNLREAVFSRADQCLELRDPVALLIDRVQDAAATHDPDVRYFLRRIPRGDALDPEATQHFMRRTFAAWKSRQQQTEAVFEEKVARAIAQQRELVPLAEDGGWRNDLSARTGVEVDFIVALDAELVRIFEEPPSNTEGWVRWFFGWLSADAGRLQAVLGHRLPQDARESLQQGDLFGGGLADTVWAWMSGETLLKLNLRCGGKVKNPGACNKARKMVRLMPDLAFAIGLATRVRRKQLEAAGQGVMQLVLASLALCVREGAAEPEIAALRQLVPPPCSRLQLNALWAEIASTTEPRNEFERFTETKDRVGRALEAR
jgi:hypothetical protein